MDAGVNLRVEDAIDEDDFHAAHGSRLISRVQELFVFQKQVGRGGTCHISAALQIRYVR
jgi:hypothetical protein